MPYVDTAGMQCRGADADIQCHVALQVLADLSKTLIFDRSYLNPTILEPFLRQYQVLPGRTHPTMNGTAHGGYILHAIRIYDTEGASSARATGLVQDRPNKKKRR